jgi:hypothetical protein
LAKIYSPNKQFTGVSATVAFANGVGETDEQHLIEWFEEKGYTVESVEQNEKPIEKWNKDELVVLATEMGIATDNLNKADVLALIQEELAKQPTE